MYKEYMFGKQRNFDRVQFEDLRKIVDPQFNEFHDILSDCYYNYWKIELSKPWIVGNKTYDVQSNIKESKRVFDKLHGLIFMLQEIELDIENTKQGNLYPIIKIRMDKVNDGEFKNRKQILLDNIQQLKTEGFEIKV